jgi:hypothetical protein
MVTSWFPPVQDIKICELFTYGKNRRVLVFLETCRVQVSEGFLILDPVLYFNIFKIKNRPRKVFKKNKIKSPGFKVLVLRHFTPISFRRWFLDKGYEKFYYFKH